MENLQSEDEKIELIARISSDPWEFSKFVFTIDEATREVRRFPWEKAYIKLAFRILQIEKKIAIPKSRRVMMTWTVSIFVLWDTMFHSNTHSAVCSKKEEDAAWVIENRIKFMYDNLDPVIPRDLLPQIKFTYNLLQFLGINSKIEGYPQGANQLRMYTFSNIMADEMAFWEEAQGTWTSAKPTLDGGGRFIGISSPFPGFFKKMVFDTIEEEEGLSLFAGKNRPKRKRPMQGVSIWRNTQNSLLVLEIHYTADPDKRSPEFKAAARAGIAHRDYLREYELCWESYDGLPVYGDYSSSLHEAEEELEPHLGLPLLRGWDFGLTPACLVMQYREGELVALIEYVAIGMGISRFSDIVLEDLRVRYPSWSDQKEDFLDYIDPAGFVRKDTDEKSCADIMKEKGMRPRPGLVTFESRKKSVEEFLVKTSRGKAVFRVNASNCPTLVEGFVGGYQYPKNARDIEPDKLRPLKNKFSHIHDALQMVTGCIKILIKKHSKSIPQPQYKRSR